MNRRIVGIDVARSLAIFGMIIVNFKLVFGQTGSEWIKIATSVLEGKAAALFVVLAGVGLALLSKPIILNRDKLAIQKLRNNILKKAIFLFIAGTSYIIIWPADILHFYGVYMLLVIVLLKLPPRWFLYISLGIIIAYPMLFGLFSYEQGWDFEKFQYTNLWTLKGFTLNLLYNGFHPVFPWVAFMLFGVWFGYQNLTSHDYLKKSILVSLLVMCCTKLISWITIALFSEGNEVAIDDLNMIFGTSPMPPLPIYMVSGISTAVFTISVCVLLSNYFNGSSIITSLVKTGKLALTFYIAHVIIGMGLVELVSDTPIGGFSIEFSLGYALLFCTGCVVFATLWTKYRRQGPVESIMRKLTN